ncbi:MAG: hypothetical protein GY784_12355 [Gammaproteobacteria bacterium]|nr:hypothetical protein [Gammaproteobacteria bacterium]
MTGVDTAYKYAMIGHGDQPGDVDSGNTVSGDLTLRVGGHAGVGSAFIGHQIDADGTYSSGNTYVGVGGTLTTDATSQFTSADYDSGNNTGELRIYLISDTADAVDSSATLNGVEHGPLPAPNNQGNYSFGDGAYDGSPTELVANVNYYTLAVLDEESLLAVLDEKSLLLVEAGKPFTDRKIAAESIVGEACIESQESAYGIPILTSAQSHEQNGCSNQ